MKFFILSMIFCSALFAQEEGIFSISVEGLKNNSGVVRLLIFNSQVGFPETVSSALMQATLKIENGKAFTETTSLPYGEYAISVIHDENSNGKLDRHFFRFPTEGYGVSRANLKSRVVPKFSDSTFLLDKKRVALTITLHYF